MKPYPIILHVIYILPHAIFFDYRWFIYRFILKYVFNTYLCKCLYTDLSDGKYNFWIFSTIWNYVSFTSNEELALSTEIDESEVDFVLEEFLTSKPSSGCLLSTLRSFVRFRRSSILFGSLLQGVLPRKLGKVPLVSFSARKARGACW